MRADRAAFLVLAAAAGICATLTGCASGAGAQAPAASTVTSSQQQTPPAAAQAPASHPPALRRKVSAMLTSGLYTDGPDGTPHYTLSFTSGPGSVLRGSVSFLYQDGRISAAGSFAGTLSGGGKLTLTLGDGKSLSGRYTAGHLNLAGCAAALPLATFAGGCTFSYHGHIP